MLKKMMAASMAAGLALSLAACGDDEGGSGGGGGDTIKIGIKFDQPGLGLKESDVDFAGPYYVAGQDLLVRADDDSITGPETLDGKKLCSVTGSTSAQRVKDEYSDQVQLQEFDAYSKCIDALLGGQIDALTTDDIILAGFAQQHPGKLKVVGKPFSKERYGVGLPKGSEDRDKINDLIEQSFEDGSWEEAFNDNLGESGYQLPEPPTVDRY